MNHKKLQQKQKINQIVAEMGAILVDPNSTEEQKDAAVARVDEIGDSEASFAIRTYADTISLDPEGSKGQEKLKSLALKMGADEAQINRLLALRELMNER